MGTNADQIFGQEVAEHFSAVIVRRTTYHGHAQSSDYTAK